MKEIIEYLQYLKSEGKIHKHLIFERTKRINREWKEFVKSEHSKDENMDILV